MLLSVVSTKTTTPRYQIHNRQINLGSVICRSIHSTTHDLAKLSSQRGDLIKSVSFPTRLDQHSSLQAAICDGPQRKSVASIHMRWSTTPSLRARTTLARFMPRRFATSSAQRGHDTNGQDSTIRMRSVHADVVSRALNRRSRRYPSPSSGGASDQR